MTREEIYYGPFEAVEKRYNELQLLGMDVVVNDKDLVQELSDIMLRCVREATKVLSNSL